MARISERELILPTIHCLARPGVEQLSTSQLIAKLTYLLRPDGEDAEVLEGRSDTKFSQKVRNLTRSREKLVGMGVVTCTTGASNSYWRITDFGRTYLEEHVEVLSLLLGGRVSYSMRVAALSRTRRPVPTRERPTSALAFDEEWDVHEGSTSSAVTARRKRSKALRDAAIAHYTRDGLIPCAACSFDFADAYGSHGAGYVEIHHRKPLFMYDDDDLQMTIRGYASDPAIPSIGPRPIRRRNPQQLPARAVSPSQRRRQPRRRAAHRAPPSSARA